MAAENTGYVFVGYENDVPVFVPSDSAEGQEVTRLREQIKNWSLESPAIRDILDERRLQITKHGWTPEHDNGHENAEMINASWGAIERLKQADSLLGLHGSSHPKARQLLVEAAAQLIAEIQRLDRTAKS